MANGNQILGDLSTINKMVNLANENSFKCDETCQEEAKKEGAAKNYNLAVGEYAKLMDATKNTNLLSLQKAYYNSLGSNQYNTMLTSKINHLWVTKKDELQTLLQKYKDDVTTQLDALHTQDIYINKHNMVVDDVLVDEKQRITNKIIKRKSDKNINNRLSYYYEQKMSGIFLLNLILKRLYFSLIVILMIVTFFKQQYRQPIVLARLLIFLALPYLLMPKVKKYV